MNEFKTFAAIAAEPSKNAKQELLQANDSPSLRRLLWLTYNKYITFRIKQIEMPHSYNKFQPDTTQELYELCMLLAKHETGANAAKRMIMNLLAKCTEENALWVCRILCRDLNIGIDESTINKVFPDLVPTFSCQLAYPIYSKRKDKTGKEIIKNYWPKLKYPLIVEEKLDGFRVIAVCKDGKVTFYSREGHELDDKGVFAPQILKLMPGVDFVLDGEVIAKRFNPNNKVALKYKDDNWPFESGKSMFKASATTAEEVEEYLGFYTWDILSIEYFESQGKQGEKKPLKTRKAELNALFDRQEKPLPNIFLVPNIICHSEQNIRDVFAKVRAKGGQVCEAIDKKGNVITFTIPRGEGVMVKDLLKFYEFKRSDAILKVKEFFTMDLRIVGAYEGEKDTACEGTLGGLNLASDCEKIKTKCGGGFSEDKRMEFWMMYLNGTLCGLIVEVSYMDVTVDGALRHPNFIRVRDDRTTTSVEG